MVSFGLPSNRPSASRLRPLLLCLLAVCLAFYPRVDAQTSAGAPPLTKAQWRDDLRYLARELPKRHKNAFHATTREQFERDVAAREAAIPSLEYQHFHT